MFMTIDADGFDPSVIPCWNSRAQWPFGMKHWHYFKNCQREKHYRLPILLNVHHKGNILSEYTLAKLAYRIIGYIEAVKGKSRLAKTIVYGEQENIKQRVLPHYFRTVYLKTRTTFYFPVILFLVVGIVTVLYCYLSLKINILSIVALLSCQLICILLLLNI